MRQETGKKVTAIWDAGKQEQGVQKKKGHEGPDRTGQDALQSTGNSLLLTWIPQSTKPIALICFDSRMRF